MAYTSERRFLGLPLFEYRTATVVNGVVWRGVARAWIAIGDVAIGGVAIGGLAAGGIAVGGFSLGLLGLGGVALGVLGVGGLGAGVWAVGGAAFGLHAAFGGLAVAVSIAQGGLAIAKHANDAVAARFFGQHTYPEAFVVASRWAQLLALLPVVMLLVRRRRMRSKA